MVFPVSMRTPCHRYQPTVLLFTVLAGKGRNGSGRGAGIGSLSRRTDSVSLNDTSTNRPQLV